jgi:hypothetical protein
MDELIGRDRADWAVMAALIRLLPGRLRYVWYVGLAPSVGGAIAAVTG